MLPADLLLIDERLGRQIALDRGLPIIGTLGILDAGATQGLIDLTHRGSGVARSLFEAAFQWGRDQGCTEVDLHVLQNSPAKSLYEGLGFEAFQIEMRRKL